VNQQTSDVFDFAAAENQFCTLVSSDEVSLLKYFSASIGQLVNVARWLDSDEVGSLTHAVIEERIMPLLRKAGLSALQDLADKQADQEQRLDDVRGDDGVRRGNVERGRKRVLWTVLGAVFISRLAYRTRVSGQANLYPQDARLNLPAEKHSHGLRRMCAVEAAGGSFESVLGALARNTGQQLGKRQVEGLVLLAAADVKAFYASRGLEWKRDPADSGKALVITADGASVHMVAEELSPETRKTGESKPKHESAGHTEHGKVRTGRCRMVENVGVYDSEHEPRCAEDVMPGRDSERARKAPRTSGKWLFASFDMAEAITKMFDEACRRDPEHQRELVALVDGLNQQLDCITAEAARRGLTPTILIDYIHVRGYLWDAAKCFHPRSEKKAEELVNEWAHAILTGKAKDVTHSIRYNATRQGLSDSRRVDADRCADYLTNKAPYLDYSTALAKGWPIATGVIEGACRHLVKDRMDITGARWSKAGAEAVLHLRALVINRDFDEYWEFHLEQEMERVHLSRYADNAIPGAKSTTKDSP
jgi:hypothetical protein